VPPERITVAPPGNDPVVLTAPSPGGRDDGVVGLLAVGAVAPRKGYDVLLAALVELRDLPWRLTIAGACDRDIETSVQLLGDIVRFGLQQRVQVLGAVTDARLASLYGDADLFVLASRYEGYGMAYAEAIAYGLPVIGTTAGAIPEVVPADAGVLVPPGDVSTLAAALRRLIIDSEERSRCATAARAAAARLPRWRDTARIIAGVLEAVA
jgi:glycosyltransferase involved in cell wall biosynthesis